MNAERGTRNTERVNQLTTYISILRGINVSGHNPVKMDALRQLYIELGFSDIQTYIQSGNVVFRTDNTDSLLLEKTIHEKIFDSFGWKVPVIVLTINELKNSLDKNPFINSPLKDPAFMHLTFLSGLPDQELVEKIHPGFYLPDEFFISGKTIYLYCPTGYGNTKLSNTFFEKKLNLTATTRNLHTSIKLLNLAENI